jgi:hypothetical protein
LFVRLFFNLSFLQIGVTATPEITKHTVDKTNEFFIVCSDGVWGVMSSQEAVDIVAASAERQPQKQLNAFLAAQEVIAESARRWKDEEGDYRDDITAVVISLPLFDDQGKGLATPSAPKVKPLAKTPSAKSLRPMSPRSPLFRRKKAADKPAEKDKEAEKSPQKKRGMLRRIISVKETDDSPSGIKM